MILTVGCRLHDCKSTWLCIERQFQKKKNFFIFKTPIRGRMRKKKLTHVYSKKFLAQLFQEEHLYITLGFSRKV